MGKTLVGSLVLIKELHRPSQHSNSQLETITVHGCGHSPSCLNIWLPSAVFSLSSFCVLGGSLKRMESWKWKRDEHLFIHVWACICLRNVTWEERASCHFLPRYFMPLICVYLCHQHRHKLISVGVGVCHLLGIHAHVILENVLLRWWCERVTPLLLWIIQASLFAELITADRQERTQACRIYLKACSSRKDCYIKIHLSRLC